MKKLLLKSLLLPSILALTILSLGVCFERNNTYWYWALAFFTFSGLTLFLLSIGIFCENYYFPKRRKKLHQILEELGFDSDWGNDYTKVENGYYCLIEYVHTLTLTKYGNKEGIYIWLKIPEDVDLGIQKKIRMYFDHIKNLEGQLYKGTFHPYPMFINSLKIQQIIQNDIQELNDYITSRSSSTNKKP